MFSLILDIRYKYNEKAFLGQNAEQNTFFYFVILTL